MTGALTGSRHLLRLVLRRDRVRLPLWLVGLGGTIAWSALAVPTVYDTPAKVAGYAATVGASPVSHLMSGRQPGIDTIGGITANEISQVAQLGVCLMVLFLVVRHTRAEEESGRAELLRSTVLGRHAATLAALGYAVTAAVAIGALTTGTMLAAGLDATGSVAYGVGLAFLGTCYAAVALVAAQVSGSARGALGIGGSLVALGYLARGVGAMQDNALVWLSPFGWAQSMNAFGDERWWPVLLLAAATAGLLAAAARLTARRDFGSGLVQPRPGHPRASNRLGTPLGLTVRLQRGTVLGWSVGMFLLGLVYGAVLPTVPDLLASNPDIADYIGAGGAAEDAVTDAFLRYILLFMAVASTGYAVSSVLRMRSEEEAGRSENVLATATPRGRWLAATVLTSAAGTLLVLVLAGVGLAIGRGLAGGGWSGSVALVGEQVTYAPAALVVAAVAVAAVGLAPRLALVAWAVVAFVGLQVMLGAILRLPDVVNGLSPFWHLPGVPEDDLVVRPALVELLVAGALVALGHWGYRRRDLDNA
ncbi:ABC transporter permease [Knoellia sp. CPCC 206450]|uniref:ABC transporter permease n=1 Tax=Knoellia tibetensis TaxID=3404798 RepID=UPI003B432544